MGSQNSSGRSTSRRLVYRLVPPPDSDPFDDASFEKIAFGCQYNLRKHESHLRDLVRDVVVLRERNLTTNAHE